MADEVFEMGYSNLHWFFALLGCSMSKYFRESSIFYLNFASSLGIVDENKNVNLRTEILLRLSTPQ